MSQKWPFPDLVNQAQVIAHLTAKQKPKWPSIEDADLDEVGRIIKNAWSREPSHRPNIKALRDRLVL